MANKISVIIDVAVDKANRGVKSFQKSIKDADGAVGKFKAGAGSAFNSLQANAGAFGLAVGGALLAMGTKAVQAASTLEESINAVEKVFGEAAEGVLELGENAAESMGLSQSAFNTAAVSFSSFAKQVAGPGGDVAAVIGDLTQRAADFASVMNLDVSEAANVFRSGLSGETEPLKRFGIDLSAASVEAHALATGMVESKSEMTESIKVMARYSLLMERTNDVAGDFADTSDGLANSTRTLTARWENAQAALGRRLIPVVEEATGALNDLGSAAETAGIDSEKWADRATTAWTASLGGVGLFVTAFTKASAAIRDSDDDVAESARAAAAARRINAERTRDYIGATEAATESTEDATEAEEKRAEALERVAETADEAREANDRLHDSTLESIDSSLSYRNQTARTTAAIREANAVINDGKSSAEDIAQAYRDAEGAALDQASAAVKLADDQAAANGQTLTAKRRTEIYVAELERLAGELNGDAAMAIALHIERLRGIPSTIETNIRTRFTSTGRQRGAAQGGLQEFDTGGVVGGPRGSEQLIVAHGGETVLPTHKGPAASPSGVGGMGGNNYNITVNTLDTQSASRAVIEAIKVYERRNGPGWRS